MAPVMPLQFGSHVHVDVFFFHDAVSTTRACLGIVDSATWLHQACLIRHKDARETARAFQKLWFQPYGLPEHITTDADPCFSGVFARCCDKLGIELRHVPAEAHYQLGRAERHNAILRLIIQRLVDQLACHTDEEASLAVTMAVHAKNSQARRGGYSPYCAALGREPRWPNELLDDRNKVLSADSSRRQQQHNRFRLEALQAFWQVQTINAIRTSVLRRSDRSPLLSLVP
eukprot:1347776-Amphidinium_carterae.1